MGNDLIGWLMAWHYENAITYNFEFFQEDSKFSFSPLDEAFVAVGDQINVELNAQERAFKELHLLKEGKIMKFGRKVVDGYVMPVYGRKNIVV